MSLYKNYATDKRAEIEGKRIVFGTNDDGTEIAFILRRMSRSNPEYTKALNKATQPIQREIELETLDNARADAIFLDVFVDTILIGWENVRDADGNELAFNRENARKLLTDLPDLYDSLQDTAKKATHFREAARERAAKN